MKIQHWLLLILLQWMSLLIGAREITFPRGYFGDQFTNLEISDGKVYIGAKDYIYILDANNLSDKEKVSTCTGDCVRNINKVLLVNKDQEQLISCGTGNDGRCEIRNLSNIENLLKRSSSLKDSPNYLLVSTDEKRPASFVLNTDTGGLYTGLTYGPGIEVASNNRYQYYLANYSLSNNNFDKRNTLQLSLESDQAIKDYLVYFKGGFHLNEFVYFVTDQKFQVDKSGQTSKYTSKLMRLCQKDQDFWSYTDVVLECKKNGTTYNLVQNINVFEPGDILRESLNASGKIMAATFASGSNPENPGKPSAVCLYKLENINRHIMEAKRNFITCPGFSLKVEKNYLPNHKRDASGGSNCISGSLYLEEEVQCNKNLPVFAYAIGDEASKFSALAVYSLNDGNGYLNKLQAGNTGKYTFIHVGTSDGKLMKINVNSDQGELYEEKIIDEGHPITGLHMEEDGKIEYVMSSRKIMRFETTDCNMYSNCQETMSSRNPLCGWCVYEKKSTFKENNTCPYQSASGHWLSSLTRCLSLDVEPGGVAINTVERVTITIKDILPDSLDGDRYQCKFMTGSEDVKQAENSSDHHSFTCNTPRKTVHTDGKLGLYVNHRNQDILLAEVDFLFYDCSHYNKCGECTGDERAKCSWDSINTVCVSISNAATVGNINMKDDCPKFQDERDTFYLPSGITKELTFNVTNLVNSSEITYKCKLNDVEEPAVKVSDEKIKCNLTGPVNDASIFKYPVQILYGSSVLEEKNTVAVYNCTSLGSDCSVCRSLKEKDANYECKWCSKTCQYSTTSCTDPCGPPTVTKIVPNTAALNGSITVTIQGRELGSTFDDVNNITLAGVICKPKSENFIPSYRVTCTAQSSDKVSSGKVIVIVKGQNSTGNVMFSYKEPEVEKLIPAAGPRAGYTRLTITGKDLGVGRRNVRVYVTDSEDKKLECSNAEVVPDTGLDGLLSTEFSIECDTPSNDVDVTLDKIEVVFDNATSVKNNTSFKYLEDPVIDSMNPLNSISSGGIRTTITGQKLLNAHHGYVTRSDGQKFYCTMKSTTEMVCSTPPLTKRLQKDLSRMKSDQVRKKRDTSDTGSIQVEIIIHLDGVNKSFTLTYFSDPEFQTFDEEVKLFESQQQKLTIKGENLNLAAEKGDVTVKIGLGSCEVIELTGNNLTCVPPNKQPVPTVPGGNYPEVNVSIGNVHAMVGYLQYQELIDELEKKWIIIAAVIGSLFAIALIVAVLLLLKNKKKSKKMHNIQQHVKELEMDIIDIVRQEFADMHTSMSVVSNNLIEQGCPYHHYQQYVFNLMFPADIMESHPLMQEPVVSSKVTDGLRSKMRRGMEEFESLILNKYFLISIINSLEQQRKFTLKDKANMCGYICTILFGRMEYLQEILVDLLGNLVQGSAGKRSQKSLFRRNETVTEKLLSNWLSICLYPHLKSQSGCPLYLLYKATQLHMEAGPIDAVTNDAKYTLSEEKLLKKYSQQVKEGSNEPRFEAKCLTLNVVVDNCSDIKVCRVLDCDTITQVKEKCLTQIYFNYPASNLIVTPEELEIEWHAGMSGSLRLRDVDNTSKVDGSWVRLNTLAHYNVKDESNMALIDPQVADQVQQQDYANLAEIKVLVTSDTSLDSTDAATASLMPDSRDQNLRRWHMVKPEEGTLAPGKSLIAELYLNRILKFKQSILTYVLGIFDTVLNGENLPPPVRFLYQQLDEMAEKNKVDGDTLHAWKSMSYPVRIWATLMKKPSIVFDIRSPPYVDTSLDVISQVFIDSVSVEAHKLSKDSPTHKLIFTSEMSQYREKVKQFYKEISVGESQPEVLREYLTEVNQLQQQHTSFNKMSALYKLYQQLEPYILEVTDDLSNSQEACRLHLDKKFEAVISHMEAD